MILPRTLCALSIVVGCVNAFIAPSLTVGKGSGSKSATTECISEKASQQGIHGVETNNPRLLGDREPIRVYASSELRQRLRLSGKERRQRLFLPNQTLSDFEALHAAVGDAFPLGDLPVQLWVRKSTGSTEDGAEIPRTLVASTEQLKAVSQWAQANALELQFHLELDPSHVDPEPPRWLRDLPDVSDPLEWQMVSFYRFVSIGDPATYASMLTSLWRPLGVRGRVYVATEGINAQMAVPLEVFDRFVEATNSTPTLAGVYLNRDSVRSRAEFAALQNADTSIDNSSSSNLPFESLHVRVRDQIVADGGLDPLDWTNRVGKGMTPEEWHNAVDAPETVVLDCRNGYETDVGIFDTAEPLGTTFFRQSWPALAEKLKGVTPETPILTYCTGGIRCVKVAAYLEQEMGYKNVSRLEGGIVSYAKYTAAKGLVSKFRGKNYVFDGRMAERITDDVLSTCSQCGTACDDHYNCANAKCHTRFLQCPKCRTAREGCCSTGCINQRKSISLLPLNFKSKDMNTEVSTSIEDNMHDVKARLLQAKRGRWLYPQPFQSATLNMKFDQVLEKVEQSTSSTAEVQELSLIMQLCNAKKVLLYINDSESGISLIQQLESCTSIHGIVAIVPDEHTKNAITSTVKDTELRILVKNIDKSANFLEFLSSNLIENSMFDHIHCTGFENISELIHVYASVMQEKILANSGLASFSLHQTGLHNADAFRKYLITDKGRVEVSSLVLEGSDSDPVSGGILFCRWKGGNS